MLARAPHLTLVALAAALTAAVAACGDSGSSPAASPSGGSAATEPPEAGEATLGGFRVTVSGEDYATTGFPFEAGKSTAFGEPPAFIDGWSVRFEHVLVTLANIRLNADPDLDPRTPERVGAVVAEDTSAYAVDLVVGGDIVGKSGSVDEKTALLTRFANTGGRFDPKQRYAFGYDVVAASAAAKPVNLDDAGKALYADAVAKGYAFVYVGTATYAGPKPQAGTVFAKMPPVVKFTLGLRSPVSYANCRNTDLAKSGGKYPRGVQPKNGEEVTAQITLHTDHLFVNRLNADGAPLTFDAIAAQASTFGGAGPGTVTIEDLAGVDVRAVTTRTGEALGRRSLVSDYTATEEQVSFDPNGVALRVANSFASYLEAAARDAGHLNAFGSCEVKSAGP